LIRRRSKSITTTALIVCPLFDPQFTACQAGEFDQGIAVDAGARWFAARNTAPDFMVGDLDSVDAETLAWLQTTTVSFRLASADKDVSDLELALDLCQQQGVQSAVIVGAMGGRLDHQLCVLGALQNSSITHLQLVGPTDSSQTLYLLRAGQQHTVTQLGTVFSVISLDVASASISGARWPLDRVELTALSGHGLSNEVRAAVGAVVSVHSGCAFVIANASAPQGTL